jgi:hypothetical protein
VSPTTVNMALVTNYAPDSDQGYHVSNSPETHGLNDYALCWVSLV